MSNPTKPFTTDGASGFISFFYETINKNKLPWENCAITHDRAYWQGGDLSLRLSADIALSICIWNWCNNMIKELEKESLEVAKESLTFAEFIIRLQIVYYMLLPIIIYLGVRIGGQYWIPFPTLRKVDGKWKLENKARWGYGFDYPRYK